VCAAIRDGVHRTVHVEERDRLVSGVHAFGAPGRQLGQARDGREAVGTRWAPAHGLRRTGAAQRVEHVPQRHLHAGECRRIAQRVGRRLALPQLHDQIEKLARVVAFEGDDELLVVEAIGVRRVQPNRRMRAADADVFVHHPLAFRFGERVPGARLDERIHEEVLRRARLDNEPLLVRRISRKLVNRPPRLAR